MNERDATHAEVLEGEPVTGTTIEAALPAGVVAVTSRQVMALAATGFVAGAATVALAGRRATVRAGKRKRKGLAGEILSSSSFLVDVHVLKR